MTATSYATCPLCEATCGIAVEHDGERALRIRGDGLDPHSRGYICPKAVALQDLHSDPDRLRRPLRRVGSTWEEIGWDEALDEAAGRIAEVRRRHGRDAVGFYAGNPTAHSYTAMLSALGLAMALGTRSVFSSNSVDALPRLVVVLHLYGSQALLPVPDLDRTRFLLLLGANPAASNGSIMTAPDCGRRLKAICERGGRVVVMDPRRTETAALADEHHFIRPGTDAFFLLAFVRTLFEEGLVRPGRLEKIVDGLDDVRAVTAPFSPERVAGATGVSAEAIRALARGFAAAPSAACYGRVGACTQRFGALTSWLIEVVNIVTGNLDRPGGVMFGTPAVDLVGMAELLGMSGHFDRWRTRVRGLPEFNGELPAVAMAEEMDTPGPGQIRALITHAGNPALSLPNGRRVDRALAGLDAMVSVDIYLNETTRHAHVILPPTAGLERDHYPLLTGPLGVRNMARYAQPVLPAGPDARHDWQILNGLAERVMARGDLRDRVAGRVGAWINRKAPPERVLDLALRLGPYGSYRNPLKKDGLSLDALRAQPHGLDLGPLEPRLPGLLRTRGRRIPLAPPVLTADVARAAAALSASEVPVATGDAPGGAPENAGELLLIGRRHLRSNNSWMHNSLRLVKGPDRCKLLMHPGDAARRGVASGDRVRVASRTGEVTVEVELTDAVMPGVVSLPHGYGHDREGARLGVAREHAGVSVNEVTDDALVDSLSGCATLNGVPVSVSLVAHA